MSAVLILPKFWLLPHLSTGVDNHKTHGDLIVIRSSWPPLEVVEEAPCMVSLKSKLILTTKCILFTNVTVVPPSQKNHTCNWSSIYGQRYLHNSSRIKIMVLIRNQSLLALWSDATVQLKLDHTYRRDVILNERKMVLRSHVQWQCKICLSL